MEETISALEAWREMNAEEDAEVRKVLEKVVEDEAHHAAYAWKVVRWAIEREGEGKRDQEVIELLESIVTPAGLEKMGRRYEREDVELLCALKESLLSNYTKGGKEVKREEGRCGEDKVSAMVMQVVC